MSPVRTQKTSIIYATMKNIYSISELFKMCKESEF
jgi:hypothetical protein